MTIPFIVAVAGVLIGTCVVMCPSNSEFQKRMLTGMGILAAGLLTYGVVAIFSEVME